VTALTQNGASVSWNVQDENGLEQSHVEYSRADAANHYATHGSDQMGNGTKTYALSGLSSCTSYEVRVFAIDTAGQQALGYPSPGTFTTLAGATPGISGVVASGIMDDHLHMAWTASGPSDLQTRVEYGPTIGYDTFTPYQTGPGARSADLTGLTPAKGYHVRVHLDSPCGPADSPDMIVMTAMLVHVDILGNNGPVNSFSPDPQSVPGATPIVFEVKNKDSMAHDWNIQGQNYGTGAIASGATVKTGATISLTSGTTYKVYCNIHNPGGTNPTGMSGTLRAT
jgi:hypothetical protein